MSHRLATLCLITAFASTSALLWAAVPADKATLQIDHLPGKKGAVGFQHAKHATEHKKQGGKPILCNDCHHTDKAADPDPKTVKACTACHVPEGQAQKELEGKKAPVLALKVAGKDEYKMPTILLHKTCQACHQKMKAEGKNIGACTTCHPNKK